MDFTTIDTLIQRGAHEDALRQLAPLYEREQTDPEINRRIADALFRSERYQEALGMYQWLSETADSPTVRERLAVCRERA